MKSYTERVADQTDPFINAFVHKTVTYGYDILTMCDVRKFSADAILFRVIQCKERDILMFKPCFQY